MINIITYRLEPQNATRALRDEFSTEWLRAEVNKLMLPDRDALEAQGVDTSLFYNHDAATGQTRQGYPLIIYHRINGLYYLTGINQGAYAIEMLARLHQTPFSIGPVEFSGFRKENNGGEFGLGVSKAKHNYALVEWRPVHHTGRAAFMQLNMLAKVAEMQDRLTKHITGELGKYLNVSFAGLALEITHITREYEPMLYKDRHKYPAFDIRFRANALLPQMVTLGNHQALGYGRVLAL